MVLILNLVNYVLQCRHAGSMNPGTKMFPETASLHSIARLMVFPPPLSSGARLLVQCLLTMHYSIIRLLFLHNICYFLKQHHYKNQKYTGWQLFIWILFVELVSWGKTNFYCYLNMGQPCLPLCSSVYWKLVNHHLPNLWKLYSSLSLERFFEHFKMIVLTLQVLVISLESRTNFQTTILCWQLKHGKLIVFNRTKSTWFNKIRFQTAEKFTLKFKNVGSLMQCGSQSGHKTQTFIQIITILQRCILFISERKEI